MRRVLPVIERTSQGIPTRRQPDDEDHRPFTIAAAAGEPTLLRVQLLQRALYPSRHGSTGVDLSESVSPLGLQFAGQPLVELNRCTGP
ncbi:MAG: hypothetical protein AzoDbin1_04743 [Azoarcus sp.]|nr:hypothetical protein [Azoarcus sp.]